MHPTSTDQRASEVRSAVIASWVLLFITCGISLIPFLGFVAWLLGSVTIVIAIILGIVVISKGGTWHGIFILLASLIGVPIFILVAPFVTSVLAGSALEAGKEQGEEEVSVEVIDDSRGVGEDESESKGEAATGSEAEAPESVPNAGDDVGTAEKTETAPAIPTAPEASGGAEQ